jgi:hypothetical protein
MCRTVPLQEGRLTGHVRRVYLLTEWNKVNSTMFKPFDLTGKVALISVGIAASVWQWHVRWPNPELILRPGEPMRRRPKQRQRNFVYLAS